MNFEELRYTCSYTFPTVSWYSTTGCGWLWLRTLANDVMAPFKNSNNALERAYNRLFKKERGITERCFGQLKRRFPV
nr:unnamed protein product [Callosobruchus analis]